MNTFLLRMGCLFLFGFIFFQSFQTELTSDPSSLFGEQQIDLIDQQTDVIAVDAAYSSLVHEATEDQIELHFENDK